MSLNAVFLPAEMMPQPGLFRHHDPDFADVLTQGGDARIGIDPASGLNQYLCPGHPAPGMVSFSSCTASPVSELAWQAAWDCHRRLGCDARSLGAEARRVGERLLDYFGLGSRAEVLLAPSGTDATLYVMGLLASERPGVPLVSILAAASETGSGVPWAASGRHFSGSTPGGGVVTRGARIAGFSPLNIAASVALRHPDGSLRSPRDIDQTIESACVGARGRAVVHLIDGSKTGLCAPRRVPPGTEVVVDACQGRVPAERLRAYLDRGWPVLITGSKFFGGPAFAGAVLIPKGRWARRNPAGYPAGLAAYRGEAGVHRGTLLRWHAALAEMERFAGVGDADARMGALGGAVIRHLRADRRLTLLPAGARMGEGWSRNQSIFSFKVEGRDFQGLRRIHRELARRGVLLGQPVEISAECAVLRVAIGARNLIDAGAEEELDRAFEVLGRVIAREEMVP